MEDSYIGGDSDGRTVLGTLGRLPTELRLQILSYLLNKCRRFDTSTSHYNAILFVGHQLQQEMYDLLYRQRAVAFNISGQDYFLNLKARRETLEIKRDYWLDLDTIRCTDQYDSTLGYLIAEKRPEYFEDKLSRCPFHLFKELNICIRRPESASSFIDTWEKTDFLLDFLRKSKTKLPRVKVIALEAETGQSWFDGRGWYMSNWPVEEGPDIPSLFFAELEQEGPNFILQLFRQLEEQTTDLSYYVKDKGFNGGQLSMLTAYPERSIQYNHFIDKMSLYLDILLDGYVDELADLLRFRRLLQWSRAYVETTVKRIREIPDADPCDTKDSFRYWRARFKEYLIEALVERYFSARFYYLRCQDVCKTYPDCYVTIEDNSSSATEHRARLPSNASREAFADMWRCGIDARGTYYYECRLGSGKHPNKPETSEAFRRLFREDPERFIDVVSSIEPRR